MLAPDTILQNRYRIVRQLGQGGMGTVYEAKALRLNTTVALKETHFTDERLRKQFEREAQLLAGLRHPALPRVIDHFDEGDGLYLVMDFIEGEDLWEKLQKGNGRFPVCEVLSWADQLLDALSYLHSQEPPVIHRDIKPQNLKLTSKGQIILLDFGLAKGFAGQISRVTTSGSIFGYTPNYAPLEQIQGTGTEPRSDLYSLAATLYHLMAGKVPPDVLMRLSATTDGQPDPLLPANEVNPSISASVAEVLSHGMVIARNQRPANAEEMRKELERAKAQISIMPTIISPTEAEEEARRRAEEEATLRRAREERQRQEEERRRAAEAAEHERRRQEYEQLMIQAEKGQRQTGESGAITPSPISNNSAQSNSAQESISVKAPATGGIAAGQSTTSSTEHSTPVDTRRTTRTVGQLKQRENRLRWAVGGVAVLLITGVIIAAIINRGESRPDVNNQTTAIPATLTVSQTGEGQYKTIGEAIRNAPVGTRILVRPGRYSESLVLNTQK